MSNHPCIPRVGGGTYLVVVDSGFCDTLLASIANILFQIIASVLMALVFFVVLCCLSSFIFYGILVSINNLDYVYFKVLSKFASETY